MHLLDISKTTTTSKLYWLKFLQNYNNEGCAFKVKIKRENGVKNKLKYYRWYRNRKKIWCYKFDLIEISFKDFYENITIERLLKY